MSQPSVLPWVVVTDLVGVCKGLAAALADTFRCHADVQCQQWMRSGHNVYTGRLHEEGRCGQVSGTRIGAAKATS